MSTLLSSPAACQELQYLAVHNVLTLRTVEVASVRTMVTALRDILVDASIEFDEKGMRMSNLDRTQSVFVHLNLPAENFQIYQCQKEKIIIGVGVSNLLKIFSPVEQMDILTIYIEKGDYMDGVVSRLSFQFTNEDLQQTRTSTLKLVDPETSSYNLPALDYPSVLTLPSVDFQKIVKSLSDISDRIDITTVGNQLSFSARGQVASTHIVREEKAAVSDDPTMMMTEEDDRGEREKDKAKTTFPNTKGGMGSTISFKKKQENTKISNGVFAVKHLMSFVKCTALCQHIELYLESEKPLILKYSVASLGAIMLCLSQFSDLNEDVSTSEPNSSSMTMQGGK